MIRLKGYCVLFVTLLLFVNCVPAFGQPNLTISSSAGPNGSISPSGAVSVPQGSNASFSITPDSGFVVGALFVDNIAQDSTTGYTFINVQANHTIRSYFARGGAGLHLRDAFHDTATADISGRLKWVALTNQSSPSATIRLNGDSTISPSNPLGPGSFGGVAWDSLMTDTTELGVVVKQKSGNGFNSTFFIYARMTTKDLASGNGYRLKYFDDSSGTDRVLIQRITGESSSLDLVTMFREIAVGDTLVLKVEADKTMKALVYGVNGIRDSVSVVDNTYDASSWYCWLDGCVFNPPVKMGDFMIGRIPQPIAPVFIATPASLSFGTISAGSSKIDSVVIANPGILPLEISSAATDNAQFSITPPSASVGPSASRTFVITFSPTTNGPQAGNAIFTHNAAGSPANVPLSGSGTGAAIPKVTSFAPTSGPIGTTVTITGTNFDPTPSDNTVYFGAVKGAISAATSTSLTVKVPVGATYAPLFVETHGLSAVAAKPFAVTFLSNHLIDNTSFTANTDYAAGLNPHFITTLDIDGDGKPDICLINGVSNTLSIYRNIDTTDAFTPSSFAPSVDFSTADGAYPAFYTIHFAAGDLDGDGKPDIVAALFNGNMISIFRNTSTPGNISFAARIDVPSGLSPNGVALADLDGDGKLDVCVANDYGSDVSVFKNTSIVGRITLAPRVNFAARNSPSYVAVADIDGDAKPDLVVTALDGGVSVYRNITTLGSITASSFAPKVDFIAGSNPVSVVTADIDGDGKPDLSVANEGSGTLSVFRNSSTVGSISMDPKADFALDAFPIIVAAGDIDGDGKPDLAVINQNSNTVSVLKNTSTSGSITTSSFATKVDFLTGAQPRAVAIGDLNGDGRPDLEVANENGSNISIFENKVSATALFSVAPDSIRFGNVLAGGSKRDSVTVTNTGVSTLSITSVTSDSAQFSVTPGSASIAPAGKRKYYITFAPSALGLKSSNIKF
ncbi:MAG: choice-of-anchor D domain-containing protein, partial [Ignavibacteria bacterium]